MNLSFYLYRDILAPDYTLGELTNDGKHFGYTCEDTDRKLEDGGEKVYGKTAIPRGRYRVQLSHSPHFDRITPEILDVPNFTGIRIHGGNSADDTFGCILLGRDRIDGGVANCAERNTTLIMLIERAEDFGEEVWLTVS